MHTTDVPLSADERLGEVAGILAAGLLGLRTRPQLAATSDISGEHVPPRESAESAQKALGLPATARPDPHAG
ncbi:MAG: hypothetical protein ACUVXB_17375 [Bryobacteraceae bacterium]